MKVDIDLIDVCLGCYLTDHHNRRGELLLGVTVDGSTTNAEVRDALKAEIQAADYGLPSKFPWRKFDRAVDAMFRADILDQQFDADLDPPTEDDMMEEPCQAWFLVTYGK